MGKTNWKGYGRETAYNRKIALILFDKYFFSFTGVLKTYFAANDCKCNWAELKWCCMAWQWFLLFLKWNYIVDRPHCTRYIINVVWVIKTEITVNEILQLATSFGLFFQIQQQINVVRSIYNLGKNFGSRNISTAVANYMRKLKILNVKF